MADKDFKDFESQVADWGRRMKDEPDKVALEVAIAQFMMLYNIDQNISLIKDMMAKKFGFL